MKIEFDVKMIFLVLKFDAYSHEQVYREHVFIQ